MQLTPNFMLQEFLQAGAPLPASWILANIRQLANRLQVVRDLLARPIVIHSGYRSPQHNQHVGGAQNSLHTTGLAADISVPGVTPQALQKFLGNWSGGLGCYSTHTHLDCRATRARWQSG